ncbi:sugar ABC transporter ATP-binding protein [Tessaracoccus sp. Z1128]
MTVKAQCRAARPVNQVVTARFAARTNNGAVVRRARRCTAMDPHHPLVRMSGITKSFGAVKVLRGVDLTLTAGQVHALMGENGAGKSTLMRILMGIYQADDGVIELEGEPVQFRSAGEALHHGVSMIHQELNPVLDQPVFENLFLGRELRTRAGLVDKRRMREESRALLAQLGLATDPNTLLRALSVAKRQLVEIAKAISVGAKVIVMDEPTSAITESEVEVLFREIRKLRDRGVGVIYISHKMEEIFQISDAITVMRDGQMVATGPASSFNRASLIRHMVGRDLNDAFPKVDTQFGPEVLRAQGFTSGVRVKDAEMSVRAGEILGIAGLVGAGRSELMECIFGLRRKESGRIFIRGKEVRIRSPRDAIRHRLAFLTEDRKSTGLNLVGSVQDNITAATLRRFARGGFLRTRLQRTAATRFVDRLRIKTAGLGQAVRLLSGGNQQKVVLAKWLLSEPDIIILDEPTRGIDVGAKREIYLLLGELVSQGKAVILISSEMPEVMGLADRIVVMAQGRVTGELHRSEFSQEQIMHLAATFEG